VGDDLILPCLFVCEECNVVWGKGGRKNLENVASMRIVLRKEGNPDPNMVKFCNGSNVGKGTQFDLDILFSVPETLSGAPRLLILGSTPMPVLESVHTNQCISNYSEIDKSTEYNVQFIISSKNLSESFQAQKVTLDFIPLLVTALVIIPGLSAISFGRHNRNKALLDNFLTHRITLIGSVHKYIFLFASALKFVD
jgi:hypothetical protein